MVVTWIEVVLQGSADSIWTNTVLASFVYELMKTTSTPNAYAGYVEAAQGIANLVVALPVGYAADKFSKARIVALGGVLMPVAVASTAFAVIRGVQVAEDDDNAYADAAPDTVTLLDFPTSRKLLVDESVWHVSKPPALKGHALQAPILVMQLAKFQNLEKGTAQDAAQAWWRTMFLGAGEDDSLKAPPAGFFKWK